MHDIQQVILKMLSRIGVTNKTELVNITGASMSDIRALERELLIRNYRGDVDMTEITALGKKLIGIKPKKALPRATPYSEDHYTGADLLPFTGRLGCNEHLSLPSRHCDQLRYLDGTTRSLENSK